MCCRLGKSTQVTTTIHDEFFLGGENLSNFNLKIMILTYKNEFFRKRKAQICQVLKILNHQIYMISSNR
jgi:hypothetical protein